MNSLEKQVALIGCLCGTIWLLLCWKTINILIPLTGADYWVVHIVLIILISLFCIHCLKGVGKSE